jgi:Holliday junction DNA helicase RuvA
VGLLVRCTTGVLDALDGVGRPAHVYTHLHVREDELSLYGCASEEERRLFELLLTISGVGPKIALAVLSTLSPDVLRQAVAREQAEVLDRVPGIGRKMAERMMLQLKDKLGAGITSSPRSTTWTRTCSPLTALGYSIVEAQAAINLSRDRRTLRLRASVGGLAYLAPRYAQAVHRRFGRRRRLGRRRRDGRRGWAWASGA